MKRFRLTLLLVSAAIYVSYSQSLDQLRTQSESLEKEIAAAETLLNETRTRQTANDRQLRLASTNRKNREKLVTNLNSQITVLNREVKAKSDSIEVMTKEVEALKAEYADMIRSSYKNYKLNNYMAFLFASTDFNDAARRIYYMKRYTLMRERKAEVIDSLRGRLTLDLEQLASKKGDLDGTKTTYDSEVSKLRQQEKEYQGIRTSINTQAKRYDREISAKRTEYNKLQAEIKRMIEEEARRAQAQAGNRSVAEQEAFVKLTGRFVDNKGKLPYPVTGGVIVQKFGSDVFGGVTVKNEIIAFATKPGATVKAVFEGEVKQIWGAPANIMISHGDYITVYSNIEIVNVKKGDKVDTNQAIGKIYSGPDNDYHILRFGIYNGKTYLNPELWLKR